MIKFQSTPVISDGRIPAGKRPCWQSQGFNPRPSFLTGESKFLQGQRTSGAVSIHARHF